MTDQQAIDLIAVFQAHWHTWQFSAEETSVWIQRLRRFDFSKAKHAVNNFYMDQTKQGKPAPGSLLAAIRRAATVKADLEGCEMVQLFEICRADGRRRFYPFSGPAGTPRAAIEAHAQAIAERCNRKESGHYINYFV